MLELIDESYITFALLQFIFTKSQFTTLKMKDESEPCAFFTTIIWLNLKALLIYIHRLFWGGFSSNYCKFQYPRTGRDHKKSHSWPVFVQPVLMDPKEKISEQTPTLFAHHCWRAAHGSAWNRITKRLPVYSTFS